MTLSRALLVTGRAQSGVNHFELDRYKDVVSGMELPPANYETEHWNLINKSKDGAYTQLCLNSEDPGSSGWIMNNATRSAYTPDNIGSFKAYRIASAGAIWHRYNFYRPYGPPVLGAPTGKLFVRIYYKAGSSGTIYMSCYDSTAGLSSEIRGSINSTIMAQLAGTLTIIKHVQDNQLGCRVLEFTIDFLNKNNDLYIGIGPYSTVVGEYITVLGADVFDTSTARPHVASTGTIVKVNPPILKAYNVNEYVRDSKGKILTFGGYKQLCLNSEDPGSSGWTAVNSATRSAYVPDNIGPFKAYRIASGNLASGRYEFYRSTLAPASGAPTGKMFVRIYYKAGSSGKIYIRCYDNTTPLNSEIGGTIGSTLNIIQGAGTLTIIRDVQDNTLGCRVLEFTIDFTNKSNSLSIGIGPYSTVVGEYITVLGADVFGAIGTGDITTWRPHVPSSGSIVTVSGTNYDYNAGAPRGIRVPIEEDAVNVVSSGVATGSNLVTTNPTFSGWTGGKPTGYTVKEHFFNVISSQVVSGVVQTTSGQSVTIYWGDGTSNTYTGTTDQNYSKDYGSVGNRVVTIVNKSNLTKFTMTTSGTNIKLDLSSIPSSMTYFYCSGSNTISGNLSSIPSSMTYFYCSGNNTITGNLSSLPSSMTYFVCIGSNTITGNLSSLPSVMTYFYCSGNNTITGNLSSLPSSMTYLDIRGSNTITGDLSSLPSVMTYFYCAGSNTITGNLSSLPSSMTSFTCYGNNTITGNLSSLPSTLNYFNCTGSNTITGNLSSLPSVMTYFNVQGSNTITGNLSSLPSVMTYFRCDGSNTISDYTTRVWSNNMRRVYHVPVGAGGLSSAEVDQLLIDLALVTTWTIEKEVYLKGTNSVRTAASDAAVTTLQGKGVTVTTN